MQVTSNAGRVQLSQDLGLEVEKSASRWMLGEAIVSGVEKKQSGDGGVGRG